MVVLFCVLWSALVALAQDSSAVCRICSTRGYMVCGKHGRDLAREQGPGVVHCSVATECKVCAGALATDCKQCANPTVEQDLAARQKLAQEWLAKRRTTVDQLTAREPYLHLETPHFDLAWTLKPATIGTEKVDSHARLHIYGDRLEALRATFLQVLEVPDVDLPERCTVVMNESAKDHGVLGPRLTGMGTANSVGLKLMGPEFAYSMWQDRRSLPDDEAVHRNLVHNVTHLLLTQMKPALYL
ncbi:MAG: hypothetical protein JNK15_20495, partial [Planctomycetes bacterium]|nr:hypothetical protein [Planctomycetota bacterium]